MYGFDAKSTQMIDTSEVHTQIQTKYTDEQMLNQEYSGMDKKEQDSKITQSMEIESRGSQVVMVQDQESQIKYKYTDDNELNQENQNIDKLKVVVDHVETQMDGFQDQNIQMNQAVDQETQIISKYTDQHEMNYENQIMSRNV